MDSQKAICLSVAEISVCIDNPHYDRDFKEQLLPPRSLGSNRGFVALHI